MIGTKKQVQQDFKKQDQYTKIICNKQPENGNKKILPLTISIKKNKIFNYKIFLK